MNTWEQINTIAPIEIHNSYTGIYNGEIYIFGGYDKSGYSDKVVKYNIKSNEWVELDPLPFAICNKAPTQAPCINGKFYIVGGEYKDESETVIYTDMVMEYNPVDGSVAMKRPRPFAGSMSLIVQVDDSIYSFGGYNGTKDSNGYLKQTSRVYAYNTKTDTWTEKAAMRNFNANSSTYYYASRLLVGAYDGERYCYVGGGTGYVGSGSLDESATSITTNTCSYYNAYDTVNDTWVSTVNSNGYFINVGSSLYGTQLVGLNGGCIITGGYSSSKSTEEKWQNITRLINPKAQNGSISTVKAQMPIRLAHHACVTDGKYAYVMGGVTVNDAYNYECYRYSIDIIPIGVTLRWDNPTPSNSTDIPTVSNLTFER